MISYIHDNKELWNKIVMYMGKIELIFTHFVLQMKNSILK